MNLLRTKKLFDIYTMLCQRVKGCTCRSGDRKGFLQHGQKRRSAHFIWSKAMVKHKSLQGTWVQANHFFCPLCLCFRASTLRCGSQSTRGRGRIRHRDIVWIAKHVTANSFSHGQKMLNNDYYFCILCLMKAGMSYSLASSPLGI